jgi:chorismate synthase
VDAAKKRGTTLGGGFAVIAFGMLPGLGGFAQWDERLDGLIAQALMSVPAVKAVGIGSANWLDGVDGSAWHDEILRQGGGISHSSNHAGGITGGVSNGMPVVAAATVKPIPTQKQGLRSVNLTDGKEARSPWSRCDVTAVPAAAVVAEAMLAIVLADAALAEFGGSHLSGFVSRWHERRKRLESLFL